MTDIKDILALQQPPSAQIVPGFWIAKVTRPVPVSETQKMYVTIPDISVRTKWGPCHWTPRSTQATINVAESGEPVNNITVMIRVLPALNDPALVVFDNKGNPWVVSYGS